MTDILPEDPTDHTKPPAIKFDSLVPDNLSVGDIIFFDGEPYTYLHKADGLAPLIFKSSLGREYLIEISPSNYVRKISDGSAKRPGENPAISLNRSDATAEDQNFHALPVAARTSSDLKEYYIDEFRRRIKEAEATGAQFHRTKQSALIVRDAVDRLLAAEKIAPPTSRSATSILRWMKKSDDSDKARTANVHKNYFRKYPRKVPQRVIDLIAVNIRNIIREFPHMPPNKIRLITNKQIEKINMTEGLNLPKISTDLFNKEYNKYDAWVRKASADGVHQADLQFGVVGKLTRPTRINQLWELDHHEIDLIPILGNSIIKDLWSAAPLGRLSVTIAYDVFSAYPMGLYISFEKSGLLPALMCIAHGLQPKTYVETRFPEINGTLLGYGKPVTIRYDRAPEFVGRQMAIALRRVGIGFELARPHCPDDKPYIERFFGTFESNLITWLKGRTGSNVLKRGHADPVKEARIDLDDVVRLIHEFLITCYARTPQQALDYETPEQRWVSGQKAFSPRVLSPEEQSHIDNMASIEVEVNAGRQGIRWENKQYQSAELQAIRRSCGDHGFRKSHMTALTGRVSLRDLGIMYVSIPNSRPPVEIAVPCTNKFVHGRTLWQDQVIRSLMNTKKRSATSESSYGEAFEALFKRSLGYMGVVLDPSCKQGPLRSAGTAARFVGVLVDGSSQHALSRVVQDAQNLDLFKEAEIEAQKLAPPKKLKLSITDDILDLETDEIDISEFYHDRTSK